MHKRKASQNFVGKTSIACPQKTNIFFEQTVDVKINKI